LPGAINKLVSSLLWLIFHANACSLAPLPRIRMFKGISLMRLQSVQI